jgi:hypothetical protein
MWVREVYADATQEMLEVGLHASSLEKFCLCGIKLFQTGKWKEQLGLQTVPLSPGKWERGSRGRKSVISLYAL